MKRTHLQIVLVTLVAVGLVACGREEASSTTPVQVIDGMNKSDAKKASSPDTAPKAVDPLKEGY